MDKWTRCWLHEFRKDVLALSFASAVVTKFTRAAKKDQLVRGTVRPRIYSRYKLSRQAETLASDVHLHFDDPTVT